MLGYLLIWGSLGIVSTVIASGEDIKTSVKIGQCRAQCLETFMDQDPIEEESCPAKANCTMCWGLCDSLYTSYNLFGAVCDGKKKICTLGCETACKFRDQPTREKRKRRKWVFLEKVVSYVDSLKTHLDWKAPQPPSLSQSGQLLVYMLLGREKHKTSTWKVLQQTASTKITFETNDIPNPPEFTLIALTTQGVVANITFSPDSLVDGTITLPTDAEFRNTTGASYTPDISPLNISLDMYIRDRKLQVTLHWNHPNPVVLKCAKNNDVCFYNIDWFINNCEAHEDSPRCNFSPYHQAQTKVFRHDKKPSFIMPDINFNTEYNVKITIDDTHNEEIEGETTFTTPLCVNPDIDATGQQLCKDSSIIDNPTIPPRTINGSATIPAGKANSSIVLTTESQPRTTERELVTLKINDTPQMKFDSLTEKMDVNLTWATDLNKSVFDKFIVLWQKLDEEFQRPDENETRRTYMNIKLDTNIDYKIWVIGEYKNDKNKTLEMSDMIYLFTQKNFSIIAEPITYEPNNKPISALSGVIVAVVVATIFIIVGFVLLFYKKRQSFRDIIITKTFVTKSNSYKSNVGAGKSNYSNQLMVISDEWELDPKMLKFSTPLGQGAFGKVVTGYCSDQKVAIKLVKEGAPLSYKEDLVAEINLMKRIGSNPNIVAMIGACTLSEPIALVIEFVPHGNLQNFLKKCRMEGDLRKRSDGISEIAYSMVHDSGGIESYLITPADMLSFARQVAMAMEYLTDRRYVHRDLAARNVLLGHNKVVKLCDFGLSRDIYNDNQYQKLTNGKLPLKWMAIESLRDRVFTTQTDVWSFGVLLWEIVTMGASPYPHIALSDLYYVLVNGYRMEKTSNCSDELYAIMLQCWATLPQDRPCFTQLRMMLEELLEQDRDYLVLENINVPLNTSENSSSPSSVDDMSTQPSATSSGILVAPLTKEELRVNVCVHEKSTDRLLRKSESDSSP